MRRWQGYLLFFLGILLAFLPAQALGATTVTGKASTVIEWFDDANEDTAVPVYQYLVLNVRNIGANGYNFKGYGRLSEDLTNKVDAQSRLYYGYLEKKGFLKDDLDLRLGRQFITTAAGHSIIDGLYIKYKNVGPVHLSLYGGGDVAYYEGYDAQDLIWGAEVAGRFFDSLDLGFSYVQKWGDSDLTHEVIGFTGDYDFQDTLNFYTDLQYSWLTDELTYGLAGMKYHRNPKWDLRAEYLYSLPVFSSTSIYSVFAVAEYQEILGEFAYKFDKGLRAFGRVTREMYDEYDDAMVYEIGVEKIRTSRLSGYLIATLRDDEEGQDMEGVKCRLGYLVNRYIDAGIGVHYNVLERRLDETDDETTSKRFWVDATTHLTKKINLQAKVESIESDIWKNSLRGRIRFNVKF